MSDPVLNSVWELYFAEGSVHYHNILSSICGEAVVLYFKNIPLYEGWNTNINFCFFVEIFQK